MSDVWKFDEGIIADVASAIPGIRDHLMVVIEGSVYRMPLSRDKAADLIKKLADVK